MKPQQGAPPGQSVGHGRVVFTVAVFIVLASLDNAAIGILPPLYAVIAQDLRTSELALGVVTASSILVAAISAVAWGYWGDRTGRKRLLFYGTAIWSLALLWSTTASSFLPFFALQVIAAVGLGCIASVGFSVLGDFVSPWNRGFVMSLWGVCQGIGGGVGLLLAGLLGASDWHLPFYIVSGAGIVSGVAYLFTYDPERGRMEPDLAEVYESGAEYDYEIRLGDIASLVTKPSNVWLILQGFTAQVAYGSLIWLPRMFTSKVQAGGYSLGTATTVGTLFAILFHVGGVFSILGGQLGDRWQSRNPRGRATLCAIGILGAIPMFLALFFFPFAGLGLTEGASSLRLAAEVLGSLFTNIWVAGTFILALGAMAMTSVDSPNYLALINDVNLPEHRGTVFSLGNLVSGLGRSLGNGITGVAFAALATPFPPPLNFVIGLAVFQAFFLPTAYCYYRASKTTPRDIADAGKTLRERASAVSGDGDVEAPPPTTR